MHFYAWKSGLKTGMYYLRTKAAVDAIKFTLDNTKKKQEPVQVAATATATKPAPLPAQEIKVNTDSDVKPMSEMMKALIAQGQGESR